MDASMSVACRCISRAAARVDWRLGDAGRLDVARRLRGPPRRLPERRPGEVRVLAHRRVEHDVRHPAVGPLGPEQRPQLLLRPRLVVPRAAHRDERRVPVPLVRVERARRQGRGTQPVRVEDRTGVRGQPVEGVVLGRHRQPSLPRIRTTTVAVPIPLSRTWTAMPEVHVVLPPHAVREGRDSGDPRQELPRRPEVVQREQRRVEERRRAPEARHPRQQVATEVQLLGHRTGEHVQRDVQDEGHDPRRPGEARDVVDGQRPHVPLGQPAEQARLDRRLDDADEPEAEDRDDQEHRDQPRPVEGPHRLGGTARTRARPRPAPPAGSPGSPSRARTG